MTSSASDLHLSLPPQALDLVWMQSSELLAITDASGRLLQTNPRFDALVGPARHRLALLQDLLSEGSPRVRWLAHIAGTLAGSITTSESIGLTRADGQTAWVQARGTRLASRPSPSWLWQMPEITDLREARASVADELARSVSAATELLKLAADMGQISVWRHDLKTDQYYLNDHAFAIGGMTPRPEGLSADELRALIHPEDLPRVLAATELALATGRPTDWQARYRRGDGWRQVMARRVLQRDARGEAVAFVGVALDVTDQLAESRRAAESGQRMELAARGAGIGTWEMGSDPASLTWDAQMFRLRGLEPSGQAPGYDQILASVHPDDRTSAPAITDPGFLGSPPLAAEFRVRWPDGSYRWLASRSASVADDQGRMVRRVGVNWDITDAKNAAAARQEREIAHRESQAKSRFLARMSHELRTPLNAVLGFAQLLAIDSASFSETQRGRIGHIRSAGEHLLALIDDVLDLSSLESGEIPLSPEAVGVAGVLDEALVLLQAQARDRQVTVRPVSVNGTVLADRTRLRQVLVNLISNAIKYNRTGGQVAIETSVIDGQVAIRVTDTGRGLSEAQREHLFEPFNRLGVEREGIEGTGIGLAIVRALVERMQGSMRVASEPGRGSVFEFRLPAAGPIVATEPDPAPQVAPVRPAPARSGRLLYIEDNAVNVMLVEEMVRSFTRLSIVSEVNGLAGVARARSLRPDLILVDMQLPDIDGFEVLRQLRDDPRTATIRCIALSANAMPEDIARALAGGFADYWTKPIDVDRFLAALSDLF